MDNQTPASPTPMPPPPTPPSMPTPPSKPSVEVKNTTITTAKSHTALYVVAAVVVVLIILIGGAFWYLNYNQKPVETSTVVTQPTPTASPVDNLSQDANSIDVAPVETATMDADLQKIP